MIEFDEDKNYYRITGKNARFHKKIPPKFAMEVNIPEGVIVDFDSDKIRVIVPRKSGLTLSIDYNTMTLQEALDFALTLFLHNDHINVFL